MATLPPLNLTSNNAVRIFGFVPNEKWAGVLAELKKDQPKPNSLTPDATPAVPGDNSKTPG